MSDSLSRRIFLKSGALALASLGLAPTLGPHFLRDVAFAAEPNRRQAATGGKKVLICVFLRGAVDGLSVVAPHGDPNYYQLRKTANGGIALPRTGEGALLDLDGMFGLHPALKALQPIYKAGHMAAIHSVGSPNATRSHFEAQDYMESALPGDHSDSPGWLTRAINNCPEDARTLAAKIDRAQIRSVAMTAQLPRSMAGDASALAISDLASFGVGTSLRDASKRRNAVSTQMQNADASSGFETLYAGAVGDVLHGTGQETFEALKLLGGINASAYRPSSGANYPRGRLGDSLRGLAQLIKADVGLEIGFAEAGGWDTHVNQGASQGQLARRLAELGEGLSALYQDLGDRMSDVTILTMSEFGRTARQNGDGGTDHGHGTCFLALGGNVNGGQVLGTWPGLAPEQLHEGRDLAVTTDFRSVFGEIATRHMGVRDLGAVFPGFSGKTSDFCGVMRV
ncbi:putative conserved protein, DUF1501 family [Abditibacterium utsteinense]|uniref:Putative conserved protein, DUF1501 family n=1 Tax=Abditibacterium utsteinense TaxID=1960156 RepID=A0A2S8SXJ5_9BACT|nr:DUF1501 domain-containing protein [Abditibacterium utsteinense]PQV65514.1 putative conserved protein, DUF1501 family [Abditibacterium utsteinense]